MLKGLENSVDETVCAICEGCPNPKADFIQPSPQGAMVAS